MGAGAGTIEARPPSFRLLPLVVAFVVGWALLAAAFALAGDRQADRPAVVDTEPGIRNPARLPKR
jgi:hypothetical protein